MTSAERGSTPVPLPAAPARPARGWLALAAVIVLGGAAAVWASEPRDASIDAEPSRGQLTRPHDDARANPSQGSIARDAPDASNDSGPGTVPPADPPTSSDVGLATSSGPEPEVSDVRSSDTARGAKPLVRRRDSPSEAKPGRLKVNVLPWAEVSVDGRSLGRVPVDESLPPGHHVVRLSNPQLGEVTIEIELAAGGVHTISKW